MALLSKPILLKSPKNNAGPLVAISTVWLVDSRSVTELDLTRHFDSLNVEEMARYRKFIRPERQRQFLIGRILLRLALAKLLQIPADKIGLTERVGHAPVLSLPLPAPAQGPYFSLSHSGSWIACAVSASAVLGLDIEVIDTSRDFLALAEHAFDVGEQKSLAALPEKERAAAFYTLWSRKEASYKFISNCAAEPTATPYCLTLPHPLLSVVLASAHPWAIHPEMSQVGLHIGLPPVSNQSLLPQPVP